MLKHSELLRSENKFRNHDELLHFFDKININHAQKLEINEKIKKLWIQRESRRNDSNNKQLNITLPTSTIKGIKKLIKKYGLSQAQIIRIVMDAEAQNDYHLKKKSEYIENMVDSQNLDGIPKGQLSSKQEENNNTSISVLHKSLENVFPKSEGSS